MSTALLPNHETRADAEPTPRRWTREEFDRLADFGLFRCQRAELIEGEIMVFSPQGPSHSYGTDRAFTAIGRSGWQGVWVRMQLPMDFGAFSEPEPDVSVVSGSPEDFKMAHPTTALLIVEVSDSTLRYDRTHKASLYAKMGVAEYWIVNVGDGHLEVRRDPRPDPAQPFGFGYAGLAILRAGDQVAPVYAPAVRIAVADLLP